jgi:hypothetical protein
MFERQRLSFEIVAGAIEAAMRGFTRVRSICIAAGDKVSNIRVYPVPKFSLERFHRGFGALDGARVEADIRAADFRLQHVGRHEEFYWLLLRHSFSASIKMLLSGPWWHYRLLPGVPVRDIRRDRGDAGRVRNRLGCARRVAGVR